MSTLRPYQENAITEVARKVAGGFKKVVFQLATGGGKTVTFAELAQRYLARNNKEILILVHRSELPEQAKRTMYALSPVLCEEIRNLYQDKVKEWCEASGEGYTKYYKQLTDGWMMAELKNSFAWQP